MNDVNGDASQSVGSRLLEEFVLAEILFVEAAIESAVAVGSGVARARDHLSGNNEYERVDSLGQIIIETGTQVVEPYSVRLRHFSSLVRYDWYDNKN